MRKLALILAALAASLSAEALAADKTPKVLVLDVRAAGNFAAESASVLSTLVAVEAARYPAKVVAGADLRNLVGLERQKELMGCTENSCMAQIGGAMGVEYILAPDVGEFGGRWILGLVLLDVAKANAVRRVSRVSATQGGLVDQVGSAVAEALSSFGLPKEPVAPRPAEPLPNAAPTSASTRPEPAAASAPAAAVTAPAASPSSAQKVAGFSLIGVGAAAAIGGVVAGVLGKSEHDDAVAHPPAATEVGAKRASVDAKLWAADGLFIGAAVAGATGLVLVLTAPSSSSAPPTKVSFAPAVGGGSLVVSGGF
ncbi:MAG: hypothetical protein QM765_34820 [Myxococcales bacterium]